MHRGRIVFCVFLMVVTSSAIYLALDWPFKAKLFPLSVSIPLFILAGIQLLQLLVGKEEIIESAAVDLEFSSDVPPEIERRRVIVAPAVLLTSVEVLVSRRALVERLGKILAQELGVA